MDAWIAGGGGSGNRNGYMYTWLGGFFGFTYAQIVLGDGVVDARVEILKPRLAFTRAVRDQQHGRGAGHASDNVHPVVILFQRANRVAQQQRHRRVSNKTRQVCCRT
jgi:hypothetical protein